jgi:hypothetical protein
MNNFFIVTLCSAVFVLNGLGLSFAVEGRVVGQGMEPPPMNANGKSFRVGRRLIKYFPEYPLLFPTIGRLINQMVKRLSF